VNRLSSSRRVPRPRPQAALLLFLLTALPGAALAQKPVAAAPAPAPSLAPMTPPAPVKKEAAVGERVTQEMLAGDKRLDRLVSLDVISVPLGEVLQQQSIDKSTDKMEDGNKFVLTAAPDCADLKMQIRLNHRPLRTLMIALAEMLPGTWTRTRHGYNLAMTREAANARSEWWRLFLGEREKALAAQRQAVLGAMQTKARRRQIGDSDTEQSDRAAEEATANQHDFFHSLPQALKEQIAANMDDSPFYEVGQVVYGNGAERTGTLGWLSQMPPETQEKFKAAMQDNVNRMAQAPPAFQKYATQAQRDLAAFDPSKVYFLFQNEGVGVMATPINGPPSVSSELNLDVPETLSLPVLLLDQTQLADEVYGGAELSPGWKRKAEDLRTKGDAIPPVWRQLVYDVYGMGDAAPDEWKRLAAYQRSRVWPNTLPKLTPKNQRNALIEISRAGRMDWLGEQGHMEYVSDYYSQGGYAMPADQKKRPVRRPPAKEMDEIAADHDVSWAKDADGITLVRNNRWYRDDGLEVPLPLLRRWFGALLQARRQEASAQSAVPVVPQTPAERTAALRQTWDWAAEVFSTLTPWQIRNGLALFQPEEKDLAPQNDATAAKLFEKLKHEKPQGIAPPGYDAFVDATRMPPFSMAVNTLKGCPHTMHLYGSLDNTGRTALLAGQLPASALGPAQLSEAVSLLPLLPSALQSFPADSVLLSLPTHWRASDRILFGQPAWTRLEVSTPPQNAPQSAP